MKISILTTITNPHKRQDKWLQAVANYSEFADEVVVVDGSTPPKKVFNRVMEVGKRNIKFIHMPWPEEWNWVELPKHLNAGREICTGDWIIKLDIDQMFHENDYAKIREALEKCPDMFDVATFQKMTVLYGGKYYQKGEQPIAFRNKEHIMIGEDKDNKTDLCFAVDTRGVKVFKHEDGYPLPVGKKLESFKTGITYWNYDYFFKTKEFTKKEFWRFSRAYHRYYRTWAFGDSEKRSFEVFLNMMKGRQATAPYEYRLADHPKYIRRAVEKLSPEQFGYNAWGLLK